MCVCVCLLRSHGIIGLKTCPIGSRSWGLACGTAKKLSAGSTFLNSLGRKHNLFKEGDNVGVLLDLNDHTMSFYRYVGNVYHVGKIHNKAGVIR